MIRLLAFLEATNVTGPAKNLLEFARFARSPEAGEALQIEIATFRRGAGENAFFEAVRSAGIPLHPIDERHPFAPATLDRTREVIAAVKPDIVQTHAIKSHFLVRLTGIWKRLPWVASHHGYTSTNARLRVYNQLDRWSLRKAARVLTVSDAFRRQLLASGVQGSRITVLHNAIDARWGDLAGDPGLRASTRLSLGIEPGEKAALIVGRLSKEKAHVNLIRALAELRDPASDPVIKLMIVGEGPERAAIDSEIRATGLTGRVLFCGQVGDVKPFYAAADLAILASVTEGSPNALLEAMAAQVPVVATAVGGVPEIVSHQDTALLVSPGDVPGMAHAIRESFTMTDDSAARAQRARALIVSRYSHEERARILRNFYAETLRGARS